MYCCHFFFFFFVIQHQVKAAFSLSSNSHRCFSFSYEVVALVRFCPSVWLRRVMYPCACVRSTPKTLSLKTIGVSGPHQVETCCIVRWNLKKKKKSNWWWSILVHVCFFVLWEQTVQGVLLYLCRRRMKKWRMWKHFMLFFFQSLVYPSWSLFHLTCMLTFKKRLHALYNPMTHCSHCLSQLHTEKNIYILTVNDKATYFPLLNCLHLTVFETTLSEK